LLLLFGFIVLFGGRCISFSFISVACSAAILHFSFFFFSSPASTEIYTLSLHDALPISGGVAGSSARGGRRRRGPRRHRRASVTRSEEHTSELQSRVDLVCRLLLEKKKKTSFTTESNTALSDVFYALDGAQIFVVDQRHK